MNGWKAHRSECSAALNFGDAHPWRSARKRAKAPGRRSTGPSAGRSRERTRTPLCSRSRNRCSSPNPVSNDRPIDEQRTSTPNLDNRRHHTPSLPNASYKPDFLSFRPPASKTTAQPGPALENAANSPTVPMAADRPTICVHSASQTCTIASTGHEYRIFVSLAYSTSRPAPNSNCWQHTLAVATRSPGGL